MYKIFLPLFLFIALAASLASAEVPMSIDGRITILPNPEKTIVDALDSRTQLEKQSEPFIKEYRLLRNEQIDPQVISETLQLQFPLSQRLQKLQSPYPLLPSKLEAGQWVPLTAVLLQVVDSKSGELKPVGNFTLYSDPIFHRIQKKVYQLANPSHSSKEALEELLGLLSQAYAEIAGNKIPGFEHSGTQFPLQSQLKAESLHQSIPLVPVATGAYFFTLVFFLIPRLRRFAPLLFYFALILHTLALILRIWILGRPPVSNMLETLLFVPWITSCIALILRWIWKDTLTLLFGSLVAALLLLLLTLQSGHLELTTVQPVLNSNFWLTIHVLMVVGSYGAFLLSGVAAHAYLFLFWKKRPIPQLLHTLVLQPMYIGTLLLIGGTILGGVWAAQSWGRFWDWDPKESWAFISSCLYAAVIHAMRFGKIGRTGLAIGSILGLQAITFTWYGVNYLLGTGLHSYGFGNGGELYYLVFTGLEFLIIGLSLFLIKKRSFKRT